MIKLPNKIRWVLIILGSVLFFLGMFDRMGLLNKYPIVEFIAFPYIRVIGIIFVLIAYGPKVKQKNNKNKKWENTHDEASWCVSHLQALLHATSIAL